MTEAAINLEQKFGLITELWSPRIVALLNDYHVKLARVHGEFVWHQHADTDELFLVLKGHLQIDFRDGFVMLSAGDLFVVPKGVEHKPVADEVCEILLLEPAGTLNTGNVSDARTIADPQWI